MGRKLIDATDLDELEALVAKAKDILSEIYTYMARINTLEFDIQMHHAKYMKMFEGDEDGQ